MLCFVGPINGGWTVWLPTTTCSESCGPGFLNESRSCTNPVPQNGGDNCVGDTEREISCEITPCPSEKPHIPPKIQKSLLFIPSCISWWRLDSMDPFNSMFWAMWSWFPQWKQVMYQSCSTEWWGRLLRRFWKSDLMWNNSVFKWEIGRPKQKVRNNMFFLFVSWWRFLQLDQWHLLCNMWWSWTWTFDSDKNLWLSNSPTWGSKLFRRLVPDYKHRLWSRGMPS